MTASTIPVALDALVAFATASQSPTVQIIDGQPQQTEDSYVAIGFSGDSQSPSVALVQGHADILGAHDREVYEVACETSAWTGDSGGTVQSTVRAQVFAQFDALAVAIEADPSLGNAVARASVTAGSYIQGLTAEGTIATLPFTVRIEAWR